MHLKNMNMFILILAVWMTPNVIITQSDYGRTDPQSDWISLFNGKDLAGWIIHGTEKWYVDQGELVCESGPDKQYGYLSTEENYKNFELKLEFKQESNGNSGVFFRSSISGVRISGWQVEQVVPPLGNGTLPLSMVRITVRCAGLGPAYQVVGDAILMTFRTANIG